MTPPPADLLPCPCPFCNHVLPVARGDDGTHWVQCVGCGALGPVRSHSAVAIAAWNRRPQPIAGDGWNEAVKACAAELAEFFCPANPSYRSKDAMAEDMTLVIARHFQAALRRPAQPAQGDVALVSAARAAIVEWGKDMAESKMAEAMIALRAALATITGREG
jgi:hypothetical protein